MSPRDGALVVADRARAAGITVNELGDKAIRDRLVEGVDGAPRRAEDWARVRRNLAQMTVSHSGGVARQCRWCKAPIVWALTPKGRRMPIDPLPHPGGSVRVTRQGDGQLHAEVLRRELDPDLAEVPLWRPHYATCPQTADTRRPHLAAVADDTLRCEVCGYRIIPIDGCMVHPTCGPDPRSSTR